MAEKPSSGRPLHERVGDVELIQQALARGVREALLQHKRNGNSIAVWQDGRVVSIAPEDIVVE